ncbi:MAG: hypothetical protein H0W96_12090, partial [Solirubrobacterales bacterium]|nr:hypothetical protein [Solirubrobacterales bacterium]
MSSGQKLARQAGRTPIADRADASRTRRLNRTALAGIGSFWLIVLLAGALTPMAHASSATNAVWAGAGTYTAPGGQVYGAGGTATLTVTTSDDTKCVNLNPDWSSDKPTQTSKTATTTWVFTLTVPTTAGVFGVTASASPSFTSGGKCTGNTGGGNATVAASYIVDTGLPIVTGVGTPDANVLG